MAAAVATGTGAARAEMPSEEPAPRYPGKRIANTTNVAPTTGALRGVITETPEIHAPRDRQTEAPAFPASPLVLTPPEPTPDIASNPSPPPTLTAPLPIYTGSVTAAPADTTSPVSQADHAAIPDNDADRGDEDDEAAQDDDPGFKATPYFAVSAGHDSNIDEEENGPASTFVRANAAIDVNYERGIADLDLRLAATFIDVVDLADNERWEYAADAGLTLEVADNTDVIIEYDREHEAISDPETISNEGSVGVEIETRRYTLLLRGLVENEQNLSGDTDFGSDPANSFDFIKGGGHGRLRLNTGGVLSPFVDLRAMVSFFPNENKAVIDRDATSYALIAGTIIALGDDFELALGGRYNHRGLKDVNIPTVANGFIDASLNWKPVDQFLITGSVSRQINEAGIEDSVASVETSFALAAIWTPDDQWQLDTRISYVESDDVGASEIEQEFEIGARLSYAVAEQFSLFAATSFLVSRTEVDSVLDERHTRLRAEAGVESRF